MTKEELERAQEIDKQRVESAADEIFQVIDSCNPFVPTNLFTRSIRYTLDKVPNHLKKEVMDRVIEQMREKMPNMFDEKGELK